MSIAESRPSNRAIYARGIKRTRYLSSPYDTPYNTPYDTIISADSTNTNTTSAGYISKSKLPILIIDSRLVSNIIGVLGLWQDPAIREQRAQ